MTSPKTRFLLLLPPLLSACGGQVVEFRLGTDTGDTHGDSDTGGNIAPFVTATLPLDAGSDVLLGVEPTATFSEGMDPSTINNLTFTLDQGSTSIPGSVTLGAGDTATFSPDVALDSDLIYTATVTTGAQDLLGLGLASDYTWSFSTEGLAQPPEVIYTTPADGETGVSVDAAPTATFSTGMDPGTINPLTFIVEQGSTAIPGMVTLDPGTDTATFTPNASLDFDLIYTATVTTGATDLSGLGLASDYSWDFTAADLQIRPEVIFTTPVDAATGVSLNVTPTATFSTGMDPTTLNSLTFLLEQGTAPISGTVNLDGGTDTVTFTPDVLLESGRIYTATITTGAEDLGGLGLGADYTWSFSTPGAELPPEVIYTTPADGETDVSVDAEPTATFSTGMDPATISDLTFFVEQGSTPVPGIVTLDSRTDTATFTPDDALDFGLIYTATVTTGAEDLGGLALTADYTWNFTTGGVPPEVIFTTPEDGETGVSVDVAPTATFSTGMDPATINSLTFVLEQGSTPISGTVILDGGTDTATFTPDLALEAGLIYTATITTDAQDLGGLALATDYSWSFSPAAVAPLVIATTPLDGAETSVNVRPTATFSTGMDPATITSLTFLVEQGASIIPGSVTLDATTNTATFAPDTALDPGLVYTATITTAAEDLLGTPLESDYVWTFSTGACSLPSIDLGTSGNFAVLAGSTVTNTGLTIITGDVGVSPSTAITGFPPGIIIGSAHAADPTAATGIADLTTAYINTAAQSLCSTTIAGNLGGQTFTPGLYTSTSSIEISSGDVTLDAQGDSSAVFIFQTASTLTTTPGRQVILTNGANAANVYWQVGSSATLGTTSAFQGTIMADQAVTLETGASLTGRALARIAAVTLDTNLVVIPTP